MRKILWLPLLAAVCGLSSLHADITIVQHVDGMGQNMVGATMFKAGRIRVDYAPFKPGQTRAGASPATSVIADLKTGEVIKMTPPRKTYTKTTPDAMSQSTGTTSDGGAPSLKPTGKKATVSGYEAEEYTVAVSGVKMSMWLTKAIPDYAAVVGQMAEMSAAFSEGPLAATLKSVGMSMEPLPEGFPVRTVYEFAPGQTVTSTVLSVSTKPIPDFEFEVPAEYKEINISP
jgi:hypothetical protein